MSANETALAAYRADASAEALARAAAYLAGWGNVSDAISAINNGPAERDDHKALIEFQAKGILLRYSIAQREAAAHREAA